MNEEELLQIAEDWALEQIYGWLNECCAWDDLIEDGALTEEELEWIQSNVTFDVTTKVIKYK